MFGAFSGFDTMEECFDDLTPHIHAVETGLSSDPPMNWRVSALDGLTLVSNSDAHSPGKLGREANLIEGAREYPSLMRAIRTGEGFAGTIEFFPEEGKYHLVGHRNCGVCLTPAETAARGGLCPVCGKKLTIGVEHRVEELADRPAGFRPADAKPFESLAPLPEAIAASTGVSPAAKKTVQLYEKMLAELGDEFTILRQTPIADIGAVAGPCVAEGIRRLRAGEVQRRAGFDGEYGTISLLTPTEIEQFSGQLSLFGAVASVAKPVKKHMLAKPSAAPQPEAPAPAGDMLNPAQQAAVEAEEPAVAVVAGPGTGKTKTLVARIAHLIERRGVKPDEITAVTFTNQAAAEMRERLEQRLGGKRAVRGMTIGTFHAICLHLLGDVLLIAQSEAMTIAGDVLRENGAKGSARGLLQAVSRVKNGASCVGAGLDESLYADYCARLKALGALDFDDLLTEALRLDTAGRKQFRYLLVDEFQDVGDTQYDLVRAWSAGGSLFVIGDPDQSIYGFRGASGRCFARLGEDVPGLRTIRLVENYRSAPAVLAAALPVIAHNGGEARVLHANRPDGPQVRLVQAADDFAEAVFVAKEVGRIAGGVDMLEAQALGQERTVRPFSDIAVLARTHRQLELIEKCLRHDDIPCLITGREDFLDDDGVRGVLAFFRSLIDPRDAAAVGTALRLLWDCPMDLIQKAQAACAEMAVFDPEALRELSTDCGYLSAWLRRAEAWLPLVRREKPYRLIEQWESAYGASEALARLRGMAVFHKDFPSLWKTLALGEEDDLRRAAGKGWESGAVRLMTLHGAKGLEFPAVILAGVKQGALPLESSARPADLEEERRLFYVGMTRAREELILTTTREPSCFVDELPDSVSREKDARRKAPPAAEQLSLF